MFSDYKSHGFNLEDTLADSPGLAHSELPLPNFFYVREP